MAAGRHNLTRRALLGAAAGAPLAAACGPLETAARAVTASPSPFALSLSKGCPSPPHADRSAGLRQAQPERSCPTPAAQTRWHRALAGFRRAEARLVAFRRYEAALPAEARAFPACAPLEERGNDLESARLDTIRQLLRAPAPDLPALALKVELAIDEEIAFFSGGETCLAAVKADAFRLAGTAPG
ncbi:MAG TPA: hypothetical protein VF603_13240 [Allosphingosinicella sp.]|jgi:hypothetical protein